MQPEVSNDRQAFDRRWRPALLAYFMRRVRSHAEAEDLTQEVFARLAGKDAGGDMPIDAYVFQIAANLLRDRARRQQVRTRYLEEHAAIEGERIDALDPYRITAGREAHAILLTGLARLPDRTRTIFILYRLENMTLDAIAETIGISKSAVKKHVMKAMATLMQQVRTAQ